MLAIPAVVPGCASDTESSTATAQATPTPLATTLPLTPPLQEKLAYGERAEQFGMLGLPSTEAPASGFPMVVLVHGGFWSEPWDYTLMSELAEDLNWRGFATWNIEFGRVGGSGGFPETFDDVAAAIDALPAVVAEHPIDLERTAIMGHSSGGHLALWALGRPASAVDFTIGIGLAAVVDLAAFPQSYGLLGGTPAEVPERYSFAAPALDLDRVVLVHGEGDRIVPLGTLAPAEAASVPIDVVPEANHFDVIEADHPAWLVTLGHLNDLLAE